jgi:hypothetical protein
MRSWTCLSLLNRTLSSITPVDTELGHYLPEGSILICLCFSFGVHVSEWRERSVPLAITTPADAFESSRDTLRHRLFAYPVKMHELSTNRESDAAIRLLSIREDRIKLYDVRDIRRNECSFPEHILRFLNTIPIPFKYKDTLAKSDRKLGGVN